MSRLNIFRIETELHSQINIVPTTRQSNPLTNQLTLQNVFINVNLARELARSRDFAHPITASPFLSASISIYNKYGHNKYLYDFKTFTSQSLASRVPKNS